MGAQCVMGQPQFLGGQFQVLIRQLAIGALRVFLRSLDGMHMARARGELAIHLLPCPGRGNRTQARMQVVQPGAGGCRYR